MAWGNSNTSTNCPTWMVQAGSNQFGNAFFTNVTPAAFTGQSTQAVGLYPVDTGTTQSLRNGLSPGWVMIRQGTGQVVTVAVGNDGASYANLACGYIANGTANAYFYVTVNSIGHVQTTTLTNGGNGFINVASLSHLANAPSNGVATFTIGGGSGYANGETFVVSNGVINATGTLTTNSLGGITALTFGLPYYAGSGFSNITNSKVTLTTSGGTNGNVTVATLGGGSGFVATATLGGRAGRVSAETLVYVKAMSGNIASMPIA